MTNKEKFEEYPCVCRVGYDEDGERIELLCKKHRDEEEKRLKKEYSDKKWEDRFDEKFLVVYAGTYSKVANSHIKTFISKLIKELEIEVLNELPYYYNSPNMTIYNIKNIFKNKKICK